MMSNFLIDVAANLSASPFMRFRFFSPSSAATLRINADCTFAFSTAVTSLQPRERNSKVIAPVPAKRSSATGSSSKSIRFSITLKIFSRAKSVVGLAVIFFGTSKRRRPYFPLIIRIVASQLSQMVLIGHFSRL